MRYSLCWVPAFALIAACTVKKEIQPAELRSPHAPTTVWTTLPDHFVLVLDSAFVRGDTLIGRVDGQERRFPLTDSATLRARKPSPSRTVALLTLTAGATAAAAWYIMSGGTTPHPCSAACPIYGDPLLAQNGGNAAAVACYCC